MHSPQAYLVGYVVGRAEVLDRGHQKVIADDRQRKKASQQQNEIEAKQQKRA